MAAFRPVLLPLTLIVLLTSQEAEGQLPSVVQLPSFQTFSYSGSVVVPDRGTTYLGGNRSSAAFSSRSPLRRSFRGNMVGRHAVVSATIIDLDEMDQQILGGPPQQFADRSVPDQVRPRGGDPADPVEEGRALVRFARQRYREGRKSDSFAAYEMAIGVLEGRLRDLAIAEFQRVFGPAAEQSLHRARRSNSMAR